MHTTLQNLAGNPALLPQHIDALIAHGDPEVLAQLHRQPQLSDGQLDALVAAGGREAFLRLIEFGAMPLERVSQNDPFALLAALNRPDARDGWIGLLATHPKEEVRRSLAERLVIDYYCDERSLTVERRNALLALVQDPHCSVVAVTVGVVEYLGEPHAGPLRDRTEACVRIALARATRDGQVLGSMLATTGPAPLTPCPHHPDADSALEELRRAAVQNGGAPASAVEEVLSATWPAMAVPAAGYRNGLSAATFERLLDQGDPEVTVRVAMNPGAPAQLIRRLYEAEQGRWREHVLTNASIPIDLLVDQVLAGRHGLGLFHWDVEGVMALAGHPDPRVRMVPLNHARRLPRVVSALIEDPDPAVALLAALCSRDPEKYREAAHRFGPSSYEKLAHQVNCPADVLLAIAQDERSPLEAVLRVAWWEDATPAMLAACLSNKPGPEMDETVADHPSASPEQLSRIVREGSPSALWAAARNANLPPDAVDLILASCLDV